MAVDHPPGALDDHVGRNQHGPLEGGREGVGDRRRVKTGDRAVEGIETELVHGLSEFRTDPEHGISFIDDEEPVGLAHALGHSLDVPVLAEGVETESQRLFLAKEGCDDVQGYLTGRPLPIAAYAAAVGREAGAAKLAGGSRN